MPRLLIFPFALMMLACAGPKKETGVIAPECGRTAITVHDLEALGFKPAPGKIGIMRIFATWCPYCKEDLTEIGRQFQQGDFNVDNAQVFLLAFKNSKESKAGFDEFVHKTFPRFGIPLAATQIILSGKGFQQLSKTKSSSGDALFTGWQGMPFGLLFGKDGRLAFRGHFTTSPQFQDGHYQFIKQLITENCAL